MNNLKFMLATLRAGRGMVLGSTVIVLASCGGDSTDPAPNPLPAGTIATGIHDAATFTNKCPTNDPAYAIFHAKFAMLADGVPVVGAVDCIEPYTNVTYMTDELLTMQTMRLIYYLSQGTAGKLPWTQLALYEWMTSEVAGIDLLSTPGLSSQCCEIIGGKKYIMVSRKSQQTLAGYHDWNGVYFWAALLSHEARHASGPGHVNGCPAFPLASDPTGCDATYDLTNLGSYGVQYWYFSNIAAGMINVGIGCAPAATAQTLATKAASDANVYLKRFVINAPPTVTATMPYGGTCIP